MNRAIIITNIGLTTSASRQAGNGRLARRVTATATPLAPLAGIELDNRPAPTDCGCSRPVR